ncbi:unnamed protein product [Prorocentrum cordatum]|uniref:ADP,ATP carrier protein n=1 Tax=Prorocentrum cordatum TaxID=2364126 RepID=A0ABN9Y4Z0_9DINO|nr:unnamed protein product [Polarella glacialis]
MFSLALNTVGLFAMGLTVAGGLGGPSSGGWELRAYLCGHAAYTLGSMIRDTIFPPLTACFPEDLVNRLSANRRSLVHVGALVGGTLVAAGRLGSYILAQAAGMLLCLALLARTVAAPGALDSLAGAPAPSVRAAAPVAVLSCGGAGRAFPLLVLSRFFQSLGFVSTSTVVLLVLLRANVRELGAGGAASLVASAGVVGHFAGLAANLGLGRRRAPYGVPHVLASAALYSLAMGCYPSVRTPAQFLAVTAALRGARTLGKATSDALALRAARPLGPRKAAALLARRMAFKCGLLAGKYGVAPLLALGDEQLALRLVFALGAAASLLGALLQLPTCWLAASAGAPALEKSAGGPP